MEPITLWAYALITVFMALIMTKRMSVITSLVLVPISVAVLAGFRSELGPMMSEGVKELAPTGVMLMFAILYFGVMIDAGLFDPVVRTIVHLVQGDPLKVVVGTAVLALFVSLDGDGSTTYLVTTTAMLPLYVQLGISRLVLASVIMQAGGVMNLLPWGGPTARAATALQLDVQSVFVPLVPGMIAGAAWVVFVAWILGRHERNRLGVVALDPPCLPDGQRLPKKFWVNLALTTVLLGALMAAIVPLAVLFLVAFSLALVINHPTVSEQRDRVAVHAPNALAVAAVIFAAGVFTGILSGTRMLDAIATSVVRLVPVSLGPYLAVITAVLSIPFTFVLSNDAFYFGVVPILSEAAGVYGLDPHDIARASLMGQPVHLLSPLVPSTYLLVGLAGVDFGDHQRFTLKWTIASALLMLVANIALGVIPLVGWYPE